MPISQLDWHYLYKWVDDKDDREYKYLEVDFVVIWNILSGSMSKLLEPKSKFLLIDVYLIWLRLKNKLFMIYVSSLNHLLLLQFN